MAENKFKYWAFLSYCPEDNHEPLPDSPAAGRRCWANWLLAELKNFSTPPEFVGQINGRGEIIPERIGPVFRDESELPGDASLSAETRQALEQSACLIVVCSPSSAQSRRVNEAVRYFKQLGRSHRILPFVVAGEPNTSSGNHPGGPPAADCYVPALRHPVQPDGTLDSTRSARKHIFVDARHGVEQREILAQDLRPAEADLELAKIQLIALLIGVGFDGLWSREQKRHFLDLAEAKYQAREALEKVAETRRQLEEAQHHALASQNLPRDVQDQIQTVRNEALESQNHARDARQQLQEIQAHARETQAQLAVAHQRALAAEGKVREAQQQASEAQTQLEAARNHAQAAPDTAGQSAEIHEQAQAARAQLLAAQKQIQEFQDQAHAAQSQLATAHEQVRAAQDQIQEIQNRARAAESQTEAAQSQVQKIQDRARQSRRLIRVFAVLAALALLAAGTVAVQAWRQRQAASQTLARVTAEVSGTFDLASADKETISRLLQKIGGAAPAENRRHSLDQLAAWIPRTEISTALAAASTIADDQARSHFQKWLLIRLAWANPLSAMTNAAAIDGKIVNDAGASDSPLYFQLAVLDNWLQTDWPGAFQWVCELPTAAARQRALDKIIPWVQSQPASETKTNALTSCIVELAKMDFPGALDLAASSLPAGDQPSPLLLSLWQSADALAFADWFNRLTLPPEISAPRAARWQWTKLRLNENLDRATNISEATGMTAPTTNRPEPIPPQE